MFHSFLFDVVVESKYHVFVFDVNIDMFHLLTTDIYFQPKWHFANIFKCRLILLCPSALYVSPPKQWVQSLSRCIMYHEVFTYSLRISSFTPNVYFRGVIQRYGSYRFALNYLIISFIRAVCHFGSFELFSCIKFQLKFHRLKKRVGR